MIEEQKGIRKAALGIRYFIKYLENHREENFIVVKNCIKELRLWILITFYSNNIDYLENDIPEEYLADIFLMKPFILENKQVIDYGKGYHTNSKLSFKEQFREIRNALVHGRFSFLKDIVHVDMMGEQASFDIAWLEQLTFTVLAHDKYLLRKGMSDLGNISLVPKNYRNIPFEVLLENGYIYAYRLTSNTSNQETIYKSLNYRGIEPKDCTFDFIIEVVKNRIKNLGQISLNQTKESVGNQIKNYFGTIEKEFGNHIKIELLDLQVSEYLLEDPEFQNLDHNTKLNYLMHVIKLNDPVKYNALISKILLELLRKMEQGENYQNETFFLRDAFPFFIKVYASLCFNGISLPNLDYDYLKTYGVEASFVHAKNIYKDYLKVLNRSLMELKTYQGPTSSLYMTLKDIEMFSSYLEDAINNNAYHYFARNMRNSVVHSQVEVYKDYIRFFTTGKNLHLLRYNKKQQKFEKQDYVNTKPIWEMIIRDTDLIALLDDLFTKSGIEIKVNISKYVKRSNYGR